MGLTETDKQVLIDIAKKTIECKMKKEDTAKFKIESKALKEKSGAFVTLKKDGSLRGCIGCVEAKKPLHRTVEEMAVASAFNDPRFPPLRWDELKHLTVEISVLTPLKKIKDIEEIDVGVHGIYITKGFHSGLLLPQVATEYQWNRLTFLEETCYKSGLSSNAWKDNYTRIYIFTADVFGQHW